MSIFCSFHSVLKPQFCCQCSCPKCPLCPHPASHSSLVDIPALDLLMNFNVLSFKAKDRSFKVSDKRDRKVYRLRVLEGVKEEGNKEIERTIVKLREIDLEGVVGINTYAYLKDEGKGILISEFVPNTMKDFTLKINELQASHYFLRICETVELLQSLFQADFSGISVNDIFVKDQKTIKISDFWLGKPQKIPGNTGLAVDLGRLFHRMLSKNIDPFANKEKNLGNPKFLLSPLITNPHFSKLIKDCLSFEQDPISLKEIIGFLRGTMGSNRHPSISPKGDLSGIVKKYNLAKEYPFAKISIVEFNEFNKLFENCLPESLAFSSFLLIEIRNTELKLRSNECGLSRANSEKLALLLNSSLISEASIAGVHILIDPPWYPFDYDIAKSENTEAAKVLFTGVLVNPAFQAFSLSLRARFKVIDNRCAVALTEYESQAFSKLLGDQTCKLKSLALGFEGVEGALALTEIACLEIVFGLLSSRSIENLVFKVKGNLKNSFNFRYNRNVSFYFDLLKGSKKFQNLRLSYK